MKKIKAVGLFSGGLDSALAIKLVQDQGIEVIALNFVSPFCTCTGKGCSIGDLAKKLKIPIKLMNKGKDYIKIVRNPKHGYGRNVNPCVDCKIYILKKAKEYAKEIGAKFLFTGEVVGQRPMSQHFKTLMLIEEEAGLKGKLVRPLCAGLLPETEAEKKGWIDRGKLLKFRGRNRTPQLDLAKKLKNDGFLCGGSGCRLTDKEYAIKVRDLFKHKKNVVVNDLKLLNVGRHFRIGKDKIIVGRNEYENKVLEQLKGKNVLLEPVDVPGPSVLVQGKEFGIGARILVYYTKAKQATVKIKKKEVKIKQISKKELGKYRVK